MRVLDDFASTVPEQQASAWKQLTSKPREEVVDSLHTLTNSRSESDGIQVIIAFALCNLDYQYSDNRSIVLSALTRNPPYIGVDSDFAILLIARLLHRGDKELLAELFKAASWSDGAASDDLSLIFVTEMRDDPGVFVARLSPQPGAVRNKVYNLLFSPTTITDQDRTAMRKNLRRLHASADVVPVIREIERHLDSVRN